MNYVVKKNPIAPLEQLMREIFAHFGHGSYLDAKERIQQDLRTPKAISSYIEDLESDIELCANDYNLTDHVQTMKELVLSLKKINLPRETV